MQLLRLPRLLHLAGVDSDHGPGVRHAAHAGALERRLEAQPQRVSLQRAGDVQAGLHRPARDVVGLARERERIDPQARVDPPSVAGPEVECVEVDRVEALWHELRAMLAPAFQSFACRRPRSAKLVITTARPASASNPCSVVSHATCPTKPCLAASMMNRTGL